MHGKEPTSIGLALNGLSQPRHRLAMIGKAQKGFGEAWRCPGIGMALTGFDAQRQSVSLPGIGIV